MSRSSFLSSLLGQRFWIPAYVFLAAGLALPLDEGELRPLVPVFLGGILYFTALKVSGAALRDEVRRPRAATRMGLVLAVKLALVPALVFGGAWLVAPEWAAGLALVAAMPAGLSSVALADLYGGRVTLALLVVLVTSVAAPVSVPVVMGPITGAAGFEPSVLLSQAGYIALLLGVPWVLSRLTRLAAPGLVARHQARWGPAAIASMCLLLFVAGSVSRPAWTGRGLEELGWGLLAVTAVAALFVCVGVAGRWLLPRRDAVAFAANVIYVNHGLAIAFATRFYPDDATMLLPPVLIQLPIVVSVVVAGRLLGGAPPEG